MKNISWEISNEEALLNSYRKSNIKDFYVMTYKLPKRIFQAKTRIFFGWLPLYLVIETSKGTPNENNSGLHYYEHDFKFTVKTDFNSDRKILASGFEECLQRIKEARRGDDQFMTQIELDKELLREQEISI